MDAFRRKLMDTFWEKSNQHLVFGYKTMFKDSESEASNLHTQQQQQQL